MKVFLDASAIIYWVEMVSPQYDKFANLLKLLGKKYHHPDFVASHLSLLECRVKPMRDEDEETLERYRKFFCATNLMMLPISPAILQDAAHLRAFHHLRTPDAIQAASALSISEDIIFITGDASFKKVPKLKLELI